MANSNLNLLRTTALFEGTSLILLLFLAVPIKRFMNEPMLVKIIGPIHGILFLAFIGLLLWHFLKQDIDSKKLIVGIMASFIPFGTFVYKAKLLQH